MNERKKQLLRDFPWEEHYPRLIAFAEWLLQGKYWNSNQVPKGQTAESIVRDVIAKTFSEERNWDPERGDLLTWLKWVIRSEISHLAESASNRLEVRVDHVDDHTSNQSNFDDGHPKKAFQTTSLEDEVISGEAETEKSKDASLKIDSLLETCSGKPELEEIVFAIIDGRCDAKPQELAKYLGRPVEKINLAIRALRRRALKIKMEAQNGRE